jgi:AmmeMemoRadiSam system protein B
MYSGEVAARVFGAIHSKQHVETFILFGAIHRWSGRSAVYPSGEWSTPLGPLKVNEVWAGRILDATAGLLADDPQAHSGEHAIEVQLPFIKHLFPKASIVPISVGPDENAVEIGRRVGELVKLSGQKVVIIASTDLTHYGEPYQFMPMGVGEKAHQWMRQNDRRMIDLAVSMQAEEIVSEACEHQNACGSGALAAAVAAARQLGVARGHLVEYRSSFDVAPEALFRMAVGYAGIVY